MSVPLSPHVKPIIKSNENHNIAFLLHDSIDCLASTSPLVKVPYKSTHISTCKIDVTSLHDHPHPYEPNTMDPFPDLTGLTVFPRQESNTLEFKIALNLSKEFMTKIYATLCGFLNGVGGHIVFGIEDTYRTIHGLQCSGKEMDSYVVRLDQIYHDRMIVEESGASLAIGTISARFLDVASSNPVEPPKKLIVVTAIPEPGKRYKCKDGTMWFRLSASNYRIQGQSHVDMIDQYIKDLKLATKEIKVLRDQLNNSMRDKSLLAEKMNAFKLRGEVLESQLKQVQADSLTLFSATKKAEQSFARFFEGVEGDILERKKLAEAEAEGGSSRGWFHTLFSCFA